MTRFEYSDTFWFSYVIELELFVGRLMYAPGLNAICSGASLILLTFLFISYALEWMI